MIIASEKRKCNIAEYLLYMWQIEDIIRANDLNLDNIKLNVISRFNDINQDKIVEMTDWYESLIDMMRRENVVNSGHLQINKNVVMQLEELHRALLSSPQYGDYSNLYYKTLPYIVELRSKTNAVEDEISTCFTALYGMLLLKLQRRDVSAETLSAMQQISQLIATLSAYFHKNEKEPLFKAD